MLCHHVLKELILQNKNAVDRVLVRDVIEKEEQFRQRGFGTSVSRLQDEEKI